MALTIFFALSGAVLIILLVGKRMTEKRHKPFFVSKMIMRGDEWARSLRHRALHSYALSKDRAGFFLKKQLPMQVKIALNKLMVRVKEKLESYFGNIRDSRLIKKQDGISEFFEKMSEVEKGNGEINETYEEAWSENEPVEENGSLAEVVVVSEELVKPARKKRVKAKKLEVSTE